ncbi:MAG: hypothetical protein ACOVOR_02280 [Rhabdochlamydiaceae bacterium]
MHFRFIDSKHPEYKNIQLFIWDNFYKQQGISFEKFSSFSSSTLHLAAYQDQQIVMQISYLYKDSSSVRISLLVRLEDEEKKGFLRKMFHHFEMHLYAKGYRYLFVEKKEETCELYKILGFKDHITEEGPTLRKAIESSEETL